MGLCSGLMGRGVGWMLREKVWVPEPSSRCNGQRMRSRILSVDVSILSCYMPSKLLFAFV
jgi:hypothetical protein